MSDNNGLIEELRSEYMDTKRMLPRKRSHEAATALEKADARILELEAEVTTLKTKPLHYDYETVVDMQNKWLNKLAALAAIVKKLRDAIEMIVGKRMCVDNLMSNVDIATDALKALDTTTADVVLAEYRREVMSIPDSRFIHSTDCADDEPKTTHHDRYMFRVGWNACRALIAAPAQGESKEGK